MQRNNVVVVVGACTAVATGSGNTICRVNLLYNRRDTHVTMRVSEGLIIGLVWLIFSVVIWLYPAPFFFKKYE